MLLSIPSSGGGSRKRYTKLYGSSDALALAELADHVKPLIIFTETASQAQRLLSEMLYFRPRLSISLFPDWETLPYDQLSPHPDLVSERLATLYQITQNACDVALIPVTTALYRLPPPDFIAAHTFLLQTQTKLDANALKTQLGLAGYTPVTQVMSPGEYSIRGGLIDLFPTGSQVPYRIDLFGDEIDTIRTFDVDTQRSIYPVKEIRLLPAREFPLDENGISRFRESFREKFEGDPSRTSIYKDVSKGLAPNGIEYYLPLFFDQTATIFDYLPSQACVCLVYSVLQATEKFWADTQSRYQLLKGDRERPLLPPLDLFLSTSDFFARLKSYPRLEILPSQADENNASTPTVEIDAPSITRITECVTTMLPLLHTDRRAALPLNALKQFVDSFHGRILLLAESLGRRETMLQFLGEHELRPDVAESWDAFLSTDMHFMLGVGPINCGFIQSEKNLAVVTENELYPTQVRQSRLRDTARRTTTEGMLRDLSEIRIGDPVVHEIHGVGRYQGLLNMDLGEGQTEFLSLEYAGGDKLYVPVADLHLISRYSGAAPESAPLHKLGSAQWEKAKQRAQKQVRDTAAELLNIYAQRAARQGHSISIKEQEYEKFAASFDFEETPDQAAAIRAVITDMSSGKPMDRLICGDVGFGKTEVALRAAFLAVMDGKQVALLAPTTLLVEQHFRNFSDRFAEWPVKIEQLSRFRSNKEQALALENLAAGKIDLVIGTHKLIQKDVKFRDLGLVIIDEEHRFGVRQKEQLKSLRAEVDVLTLTATPIPRTLSMALEGLRDFSVISTPPQRRLSIKTFVHPFSKGLIREAVMRELKRGGQIYFLHNEVETIQRARDMLSALVPEARIAIAHGQLSERELEHVMRDFHHQHYNLLLCTTIIETGIDIPTVNTIIINRADRFGLAQLHQLRGRVGRSHHQAYAYLLTPDEEALTSQAKKRLEAIHMLEDLGAGFYLAMQDLEIRGAGELLGESQSGEMQEIGFNLYADMLKKAVNALKAGKDSAAVEPLAITTEINLHAAALLPENYCNDVHERLVLYKRLANCETEEELLALHEELIDRFGLLPPPATALLDLHRLRIQAKPLGITKIDASAESILLQFIPNPPIEAMKIIALIQKKANYQFSGQDKLKVLEKMPAITQRVASVKAVLAELST